MTTFEVEYDIGSSAMFAEHPVKVVGINIGSDRAVYYTVEWGVSDGQTITYQSATVPASSVSAVPDEVM